MRASSWADFEQATVSYSSEGDMALALSCAFSSSTSLSANNLSAACCQTPSKPCVDGSDARCCARSLWPSAIQQKRLLRHHVQQSMELNAVRETLKKSFNMLPENELQMLVQAWYAGTGVNAVGKSRDELNGLIIDYLARLDS